MKNMQVFVVKGTKISLYLFDLLRLFKRRLMLLLKGKNFDHFTESVSGRYF